MVAYTGGLLGMYIGFSFMNLIKNIMTFFHNTITVIKFKFTKENLRPLGEIVEENYAGTHFQAETEKSTALGEYDKNKKTLETKVKQQYLEIKIKEQEEQIKKLQEWKNKLESK